MLVAKKRQAAGNSRTSTVYCLPLTRPLHVSLIAARDGTRRRLVAPSGRHVAVTGELLHGHAVATASSRTLIMLRRRSRRLRGAMPHMLQACRSHAPRAETGASVSVLASTTSLRADTPARGYAAGWKGGGRDTN